MPGTLGMNRDTGQALDDLGHLWQSVRDILTTPVGTRVMVRDYGSRLFEFIDAPIDDSLIVEVFAAVAEALDRWEPRFRLTYVAVTSATPGALAIDVRGRYLPYGREITLDGVVS